LEKEEEKLKEIVSKVAVCQRCSLYKTATQAVPGEGNPNAEIMFIGEAPGFYEDQQGRPFVGQAGKLLDELIQSIELLREDVFIGNVIKHRPPNNRDPLPQEIQACEAWLDQQLEILQPKIIVTLGRFSMTKFLPGEYISKIHGQARSIDFSNRKIIVIPMYHPAAALRSTGVMGQIREDFKKIPRFLKRGAEQSGDDHLEDDKEQLSLIN